MREILVAERCWHPWFQAWVLPAALGRIGAASRDWRSLLLRGRSGVATRAAAHSAGLDFVSLTWENFDLLMRQRSYFRPPVQALIGFLGQKRLKQRAVELGGYDPAPAGQIRFAA
jgi:hypothetical protein